MSILRLPHLLYSTFQRYLSSFYLSKADMSCLCFLLRRMTKANLLRVFCIDPSNGLSVPNGTITNSANVIKLYSPAQVLLVLQNLDWIPSPQSSPPQEVECRPVLKFHRRDLLGFGAAVLRAPAVHSLRQLASRVGSSRGCWGPARRTKLYVRINLWAKAQISNS